MIAFILRRWHLVTSLALVMLTITVVAGGILGQASAHKVKFHFWGSAVALEDNTTALPELACDTGTLDINGGSLSTCNCFDVYSPGFTTFISRNGSFRLDSLFAQATVKTNNTKHEGHVISVADLEGYQSAHQFTSDTGISFTPTGGCFAAGCPEANTPPTDHLILVFRPLQPHKKTFSANSQTDAVFWSSRIQETAEAECNSKNNVETADARAKLLLANPAVRQDNLLQYIGPSGDPNETFTLTGFNFFGFTNVSIVLILNEQKVFASGGAASITANGVHLIATTDDGQSVFDFELAHTFAGIHCAPHLPTDDAIGA